MTENRPTGVPEWNTRTSLGPSSLKGTKYRTETVQETAQGVSFGDTCGDNLSIECNGRYAERIQVRLIFWASWMDPSYPVHREHRVRGHAHKFVRKLTDECISPDGRAREIVKSRDIADVSIKQDTGQVLKSLEGSLNVKFPTCKKRTQRAIDVSFRHILDVLGAIFDEMHFF